MAEAKESGDELRKILEAEENFYFLKSMEIEKLVNEIANMNALLLQTRPKENQMEYLGKSEQALNRLRAVVKELGDFSRSRGGKQKLRSRPFNLNSILENTWSLVEKRLRSHETELVFLTDRTVPAMIESDPLLLGQVLRNLIELLVEEDPAEIIVRIFMEEPVGVSGKRQLNFMIEAKQRKNKEKKVRRKTLTERREFRQAFEWVETMGGRLEAGEKEEGSVFSFSLSVRQTERRSYRLPSKEWMQKSMLIVEEGDSVAEALEQMLRYFHFRTVRVTSVRESARLLYEETFDMIFVDERVFEHFLSECLPRRKEAKLIMITANETEKKKNQDLTAVVDAFLPKPFTQQKIFNVLLEIYSKDNMEGTQETLDILKENLTFLLGGMQALYLGVSDSNHLAVKGLLENTNITLMQTTSLTQAASLIVSSDIVIISDTFPLEEWGSLLTLCLEKCRDKAVIALMDESSVDRLESLKEAGVENYILTPVNPEEFYRMVLELVLEEGKV